MLVRHLLFVFLLLFYRWFCFVMHSKTSQSEREGERARKSEEERTGKKPPPTTTVPRTNCSEQWTSSRMNEMHETMQRDSSVWRTLKNSVHNIRCAHYNFNLFISLFKGQFVVEFSSTLFGLNKKTMLNSRSFSRKKKNTHTYTHETNMLMRKKSVIHGKQCSAVELQCFFFVPDSRICEVN